MKTQLCIYNSKTYIETLPDTNLLASEADALELVASCGENETFRLLINSNAIPNSFYDLSSGLAGQILLKLSNYRIKTVIISDPEKAGKGKFKDFVIETTRGKEFGVFYAREEALTWLMRE